MFQGYCFSIDGVYTPAVNLKDAEAAVAYVELQKNLHHEVRVIDRDDYIVLHAVKGEIVFPQKK